MKYPEHFKSLRVRCLSYGNVDYYDVFEQRRKTVGKIAPLYQPGAVSAGGMKTDTVFSATTVQGENTKHQTKLQAMQWLLDMAGVKV